MLLNALALIIFMIGSLTLIKYSTDISSTNTKPEVKVELYLVLNEVNSNIFIPTFYYNIKEFDNADYIISNNSFNSKIFDVKATHNYLNESTKAKQISKYYQLKDKNNFSSIKQVLNTKVSTYHTKEILKKNLYTSRSDKSDTISPYHFPLLNNRANVSAGNTALTIWDKSSVLLFNDNKIILEIKEKQSIENNRPDSNVYNSSKENYVNSNSALIIFNDWWSLQHAASFVDYNVKINNTSKLNNGVYTIVNPCLFKNCKKLLVVGYEYVTRHHKRKLSLNEILRKQIEKGSFSDLLKNLDTTMAVYYEDMSILDYTFNDCLNYLSIWFYFIIILAITIFYKFRKFLNNSITAAKSMANSDFQPSSSDSNTRPFSAVSKAEIMGLLLEMKEVQNESLVKMEDVLTRTNTKLQFLLEKLVLMEDYVVDNKIKDLQENSFKTYHDNVNKDIFDQINSLKIKSNESLHGVRKLGMNLEQTQVNMEFLKSTLQSVIDNQIDLKKTIDKLKMNNEACNHIGTKEKTWDCRDSISIKRRSTSSETVLTHRYRGAFDHHRKCSDGTIDSILQRCNELLGNKIGCGELLNKEDEASCSDFQWKQSASAYDKNDSIPSTPFMNRENDFNILFPEKSNQLRKSKESGTDNDLNSYGNKLEQVISDKKDIVKVIGFKTVSTEVLESNPLFIKQMCQNFNNKE